MRATGITNGREAAIEEVSRDVISDRTDRSCVCVAELRRHMRRQVHMKVDESRANDKPLAIDFKGGAPQLKFSDADNSFVLNCQISGYRYGSVSQVQFATAQQEVCFDQILGVKSATIQYGQEQQNEEPVS